MKSMTIAYYHAKQHWDVDRYRTGELTPVNDAHPVADFWDKTPTSPPASLMRPGQKKDAPDNKSTILAVLRIELDGVSLHFSSLAQLDEMLTTLARTPIPTALTLSRENPDQFDLNRHWLSRLPAKVKTPKYRDKLIKYVESAPKALTEFQSFYRKEARV